jgi:hypothetical protein
MRTQSRELIVLSTLLSLAGVVGALRIAASCENKEAVDHTLSPVCGATNLNANCAIIYYKDSNNVAFNGDCIAVDPSLYHRCAATSTNQNAHTYRYYLDSSNHQAQCAYGSHGYYCPADTSSQNPEVTTKDLTVYTTQPCPSS